MLKVAKLTKKYSKKIVLSNVNFEVKKGTILTVLGENGSGKSTLLKIIATFIAPTAGSVFYEDIDVFKNLSTYRQKISFIDEDGTFLDRLTVKNNLKYVQKLFRSSKNIEEIIEKTKLSQFLNEFPTSLSKGTRQRLSLAIASLKEPEIILFDEPAEGIDFESLEVIREFLINWKKQGKIILYVTHNDNEIDFLTDEILILKDGSLEYFGTKDEFYKSFGEYYEVWTKNFEKRIISKNEFVSFSNNVTYTRKLGFRETLNFVSRSENYSTQR